MKVVTRVVTIALAIVIGGFLFVHFSPDYDVYMVRSESMKPAINMGDMVITGPLGGPLGRAVRPGSIVTYQRGEELVTHRVLSVDGNTLVTKGDAMDNPDPRSVAMSDVRGLYLFRIPYMGYVSSFIRTRLGWFLVIVAPATALVVLLIRQIRKELRKNAEKVAREKEVMPTGTAELDRATKTD